MKRKTAVKRKQRRTRRDPYDRALERATERLDRAQAEFRECVERLTALKEEIPHLQGIIRALGATPTSIATEALKEYVVESPTGRAIVDPEVILKQPRENVPLAPSVPVIPPGLAHYFQPHPSAARTPIPLVPQGGAASVDLSGDDD